jgi:hypothetical protein
LLGVCATGAFLVGYLRDRPPQPTGTQYELTPGFPPIELSRAEGLNDDTSGVKEARADAIRQTADGIRAECQQAAGGDWNQWQAATAPARAALKSKIDALKVLEPAQPGGAATYAALEGRDGFPLFEVGAREKLDYLYDPGVLQQIRQERAVPAVAHWLRQRGIDLIFVPVPKMTEVYAEHFVQPCPADGVFAPHVRQALLQLLDQDVEVVDGLALFRPLRAPMPDYLYNTCDGLWAPRGMRVMAKEVADRVVRYPFGSRARYALPLFTALPGPYAVESNGPNSAPPHSGLSPEQWARARAAQTTKQAIVRYYDGRPVADDPASPVLVIGGDLLQNFREQLVRELNMSVRSRRTARAPSEPFADFVREPELLTGVRVLVWITTEQQMAHYKALPAAVTRNE